ncbi:MAG: ABC transporter ATP-binding protein [Streptococcus sp.]|nr:ABC transporter ATP-binding protein [Streptococcus sp.]
MFKLLKRLNPTEIIMIILAVGFVCAQVWMDLTIPSYMSDIIELLNKKGTEAADIMSPGSKMIGLSLLSFASAVVTGFLASRVAASFTTRLREDIFNQVMDYSQTEIKQFSIPSLLTRTTNDMTQIQMFFTMGLQVVTKGPIQAVWAITKIANKSGYWLLATVVSVIVVVIMLATLLILAFPKQQVIQTLTDKLNGLTREMLTGLRVVRAYNADTYEEDKFSQANTELTDLNLFVNRVMALMNPVMTLIFTALPLSIYWIGAFLINNVEIPTNMLKIASALKERVGIFSDMIVFSSYAIQVVMGFMLMIAIFLILPRTIVSAKRTNEVLDLDSSVHFKNISQEETSKVGEVEFKNVSFRYSPSSANVIENVSFKANSGDTIAFIGSTGSGKSTLVNLIPRFYDATEGVITIDDINVKDYSHEDLNNKVGYIPQKAVLYSGTIRSNLSFGSSPESPLSDDDMWEALDLAQSKSFVELKEDKLNSHVAQSGTNFSGGQRQRLAIARALARKPEILIFDDSFSALDYKTDQILRKELSKRTANMTKLIVAQRISTIMDADQILVLDEGKVVGHGTHDELLKTNSVYQEIAYSQLSKEELENGK